MIYVIISVPECVKIQYFQPKILKIFGGGAQPPPQTPGDTQSSHAIPSTPHAEILGMPLHLAIASFSKCFTLNCCMKWSCVKQLVQTEYWQGQLLFTRF